MTTSGAAAPVLEWSTAMSTGQLPIPEGSGDGMTIIGKDDGAELAKWTERAD